MQLNCDGLSPTDIVGQASRLSPSSKNALTIWSSTITSQNRTTETGYPKLETGATPILRHGSRLGGFGQRRVHALDGFVNLVGVLEADDDGVQFRTGHGEANGFFAVLRIDELAFADNFHADDAAAFVVHA